jgi:hypothetical protein
LAVTTTFVPSSRTAVMTGSSGDATRAPAIANTLNAGANLWRIGAIFFIPIPESANAFAGL